MGGGDVGGGGIGVGGGWVIIIFQGKSLPTHVDLYDQYMVPTLFPRAIIIFQGVQTKFHFLTKFPHLEEFVD